MENFRYEIEGSVLDDVSSLGVAISEILDEEITFEYDDETYTLDTNVLQLTFTIENGETFVILNIESNQRGVGKRVVESIHEYADENALDVVARKVKDGAESFWQEVMGYDEGSQVGEFYRP